MTRDIAVGRRYKSRTAKEEEKTARNYKEKDYRMNVAGSEADRIRKTKSEPAVHDIFINCRTLRLN